MLLADRGPNLAYRYAACGLADQLMKSAGEVYVRPKGCGHRLCPRCGRRRGAKYARRIMGWLAAVPHGDLFTMCLTQRTLAGEDIVAAKKRMEPHVRTYMRRLTALGMVGGMTTVHAIPSQNVDGWHYHVHLFLELPAGVMTPVRLRAMWRLIRWGENLKVGEKAAAAVLPAGAAIAELAEDSGDADMWSESTSKVARLVQYPMRDMAQGIAFGRMGGSPERLRAAAHELVTKAAGWKMFRAWGRWKLACPVEVPKKAEEPKGEEEKAAAAAPAKPLGFVGRMWREARKGDAAAREAFRLLELGCRNESDFARRLVKYCRVAWSPGG